MAKTAAKNTALPTFYVKDDASMDEFLAFLGLSRPERGGLPMIAAMRAAAAKGVAFTIDGYSPSEAAPKSENYVIVFKAPKGATHPGGEGTLTLALDKVRELAGVAEGTRGRTGVETFVRAVAASIGEDPDYVRVTSAIGDAPGARDLCVPVTRKGKTSTGTAEDADNSGEGEGTDSEDETSDGADESQDGASEDAGTDAE